MKAKGWLPLIVLFFLALVVGVDRADAASSTFTCTVMQAGPSGTDVKIQLKNTTNFPNGKWFKAPQGQESRMLAVALAAIINKKNVSATVDLALPSPSEISEIYLKP